MDAGVIKNLKSFYRQQIVLKRIDDIENNRPSNITLLDGIEYLSKSWMMVTPQTIKNCFRHVNIVDPWESEDDLPLVNLVNRPNNEEDYELCLENVEQTWERYIRLRGSESIEDFESFVNFDIGLTVEHMLTDDEIVAAIEEPVRENLLDIEENDEINSTVEIHPPSNQEVAHALCVLNKKLLTSKDTPRDIFNTFYKLENHLKC